MFYVKRKTAYGVHRSLVGSEMCVRDGRHLEAPCRSGPRPRKASSACRRDPRDPRKRGSNDVSAIRALASCRELRSLSRAGPALSARHIGTWLPPLAWRERGEREERKKRRRKKRERERKKKEKKKKKKKKKEKEGKEKKKGKEREEGTEEKKRKEIRKTKEENRKDEGEIRKRSERQ